MAVHKVKTRLYWTQDKSRVVEEGDPEAAYLYAAAGTEVPEADAERYGLTGKHKAQAAEPVVVPSIAADPEPKPKARAKAADEDEDAPAAKAAADEPEAKAAHKADVEDKAVEGPRAHQRDR